MSSADDVDDDIVIVGSGFGDSVSALRLAEKGWKVAIIGNDIRRPSLNTLITPAISRHFL